MSNEATFNGWAIIELFGHRQLAGAVSEAQVAGKGFVRIDIPACPEKRDGSYVYDATPEVTQYYSPEAVFSLTPTTEDAARGFMDGKRAGRWNPEKAIGPVVDGDVDDMVEPRSPSASPF